MRFSGVSFLTMTALAARMASGQELEKVVISYQSQMGGVVHFIAKDKGFYEAMGIDAEMVWYPSGAPQVRDAVEKKSWDFGEAGVVPNIIGGPQGILNVGISQDQSATNQLVGNAEGVALWPPESMVGIPVVISPNSTADFVVQACLKSQGFSMEDITWIYEQQAGALDALTPSMMDIVDTEEGETETMMDGNGTDTEVEAETEMSGGQARANLGGLWAPNTYSFMDAVDGAQTLCSGASVYATVTGGHMVRKEFAEEKPDTVARILAAWLRAVHFTNNEDNKEEVLDRMEAFYEGHEVDIPRESLELDLQLVGMFGLEQQLAFMERKGEPPSSNYDIWTRDIMNFMLDNGVIQAPIDPVTFIDDTYMKLVNDNPSLKSYALGNTEEVEESGAVSFGRYFGALAMSAVLSIF